MKIAVVHSFYSGATPSGENIVVESQVSALRSAGFEVKLIGVRTDDLSHSRIYPIRSAVNVATGHGFSPMSELQRFQPDVVHVHNLFPNYSTRWLADWRGPIVTTQHNYRSMCAAGILLRESKSCTLCPEKGSHHAVVNGCYKGSRIASLPLAVRNRGGVKSDALLSRANRVILLSNRSRAIFDRYGLDQNKVQVIPNFVEDSGFTPQAPLGKDWVFIGRLTAEKGVESLLQNWPSDKRLQIFGDGPLMQQLRQQATANVSFGGKIDRNRVPSVLANSRGLVFPSLCAEGAIPLTYVEALAAGRPVVAYSGNGASDDIDESKTGATFANWSNLQNVIEQVESENALYARNARSRYDCKFRTDRWVNSMAELYDVTVGEATH